MARLKQRADGRFQKNVYIGIIDGKRKYKSVFGKTQKEVNKKADEIKAKLHKGIDISSESNTFKDWKDKWLAYKKNSVDSGQYDNYETTVKKFERLYEMPVNKIQIADFQLIIDEYAKLNPSTGKPSSKKLLRDIRMTALQIFDYIVMNRALDFNPARFVVIPKDSPVMKRRALELEEQEWICNTPHRVQLPAMIMLYSGLRLGECMALQWKDIDLENATIDVHKTVNMKAKPPCIKNSPKTKAGIRVVNIPQKLVRFLREQLTHSPFDYIFLTKTGQLYSHNSWNTIWKSYFKELNKRHGNFDDYVDITKFKTLPQVIESFTAHNLRHTHATNLFNADNDILYIQQQLGHASPETTMGIYTHLVKEREKINASKLDKYLEPKVEEEEKAG